MSLPSPAPVCLQEPPNHAVDHAPNAARISDIPVRHGPFKLSLPSQRDQAAQRRRLRRDLDHATETNAFDLRFQPLVSLHNGTVLGAEALLFWPHTRHGLLPASAFMPHADQDATVQFRIGLWHLLQSCAAATAAPQPWPEHWTVSVRVSDRHLSEGILLRQVAQALEATGLAAERLEIRLGETGLADLDVDALLTLSAIRDLGVGLALDDFGTGFASLSSLKRLPLTAMKLDRSLIRDLPGDREDAAILRAVVSTGHALGLEIVADGIDTEGQRAFVAASGCDRGQGILFSQRLTASQLGAWACVA